MENNFSIRRLGTCGFDSPMADSAFVDDEIGVLIDATIGKRPVPQGCPDAAEAAGPRRRVFFDPASTRAAIVTCGGLCPGINDVIRATTMVLWYRYGVQDILGIRYGYAGLTKASDDAPIRLSPATVEDIHADGGTILGSSRGPQDVEEMVDVLVEQDIRMLFTVGGDGTQRGALALCAEILRRDLPIAVVGIPKTIDNDIAYTSRTFGFETAVAMSQAPIAAAHNEAKGSRNGIGVVRLMGRQSGFIAAYASLASSDVNLLLVPEVPFRIDRLMSFLEQRLERKSHAVIVAAEGAGQGYVGAEGTDASGNRKLGDIGNYLCQAVSQHFEARGKAVTVRHINPSYTIRSAPASADDSAFCFQLAAYAVHAAMSGRTEMVVSLWNDHFVHIPMEKAVSKRKTIDPAGPLWQSVLDNTGQPDLGV